MNKKTVIAFYVSTIEGIIKTWQCKVRSDIEMIDVTVPLNTMFSFFSTQNEANLEVVQIKLLSNFTVGEVKMLKNIISENKIYCYGNNIDGSLVVKTSDEEMVLKDFFNSWTDFDVSIEFI